jgi:hypothetical protein
MILLPGETTHNTDLANLFPLHFKDVEFPEWSALVVCVDHWKTIKFDTNQYTETIKYPNDRICAFSTLAIYFSVDGAL